jgi:catechol 2,3-dioxygenase-like lactoylglutathione lyase family enzyme
MYEITHLRHCGLIVEDLDLAIEIYSGFFNLELLNKGVLSKNEVKELLGFDDTSLITAKLKAKDSDTLLELYYFPESARSARSHVSFTVKNIEELQDKMYDLTYFSALSSIQNQEKVKLFFVRDYFGNILEFVEDKNEHSRKDQM